MSVEISFNKNSVNDNLKFFLNILLGKQPLGIQSLLNIDPHGLEQKRGMVSCHIHIHLWILSYFGKVSAPAWRVWEETWRSGWIQRAALCKLECCTLCQITAVPILVCRVKAGACGFHVLWKVAGWFSGLSQLEQYKFLRREILLTGNLKVLCFKCRIWMY